LLLHGFINVPQLHAVWRNNISNVSLLRHTAAECVISFFSGPPSLCRIYCNYPVAALFDPSRQHNYVGKVSVRVLLLVWGSSDVQYEVGVPFG